MKSEVREDWDKSDWAFVNVGWPVISREWDWFKGGELLSDHGLVATVADVVANMDHLVRSPRGLTAIASRFQPVAGYATFTIRKERFTGAETELAKLIRSEKEGTLYATYFVHGYVCPVDHTLRDVYGVKCGDLRKVVHLGVEGRNTKDGNKFLIFHVDVLRSKGIEVKHSGFHLADFLERCRLNHERIEKLLTQAIEDGRSLGMRGPYLADHVKSRYPDGDKWPFAVWMREARRVIEYDASPVEAKKTRV